MRRLLMDGTKRDVVMLHEVGGDDEVPVPKPVSYLKNGLLWAGATTPFRDVDAEWVRNPFF